MREYTQPPSMGVSRNECEHYFGLRAALAS